jgi:hypothetical protein
MRRKATKARKTANYYRSSYQNAFLGEKLSFVCASRLYMNLN